MTRQNRSIVILNCFRRLGAQKKPESCENCWPIDGVFDNRIDWSPCFERATCSTPSRPIAGLRDTFACHIWQANMKGTFDKHKSLDSVRDCLAHWFWWVMWVMQEFSIWKFSSDSKSEEYRDRSNCTADMTSMNWGMKEVDLNIPSSGWPDRRRTESAEFSKCPKLKIMNLFQI